VAKRVIPRLRFDGVQMTSGLRHEQTVSGAVACLKGIRNSLAAEGSLLIWSSKSASQAVHNPASFPVIEDGVAIFLQIFRDDKNYQSSGARNRRQRAKDQIL